MVKLTAGNWGDCKTMGHCLSITKQPLKTNLDVYFLLMQQNGLSSQTVQLNVRPQNVSMSVLIFFMNKSKGPKEKNRGRFVGLQILFNLPEILAQIIFDPC